MKKIKFIAVILFLLTQSVQATTWTSPTSASDMATAPSGNPTDEAFTLTATVYDESTGTAASCGDIDEDFYAAVQANHSSISCNKVRGWVNYDSDVTCSMWIYYADAWHDLGNFTTVGVWQEFTISPAQDITAMAVQAFGGMGASGDFAQVFELDFGAVTIIPTKATNPSPADSATDIAIDTDLSWTAGVGATSHDVYFDVVNPPVTKVSAEQEGVTYDPGTLLYKTTYYWRVDGTNEAGTTEGDVWSFETIVGSFNLRNRFRRINRD